jgi:hypothetical protein
VLTTTANVPLFRDETGINGVPSKQNGLLVMLLLDVDDWAYQFHIILILQLALMSILESDELLESIPLISMLNISWWVDGSQ